MTPNSLVSWNFFQYVRTYRQNDISSPVFWSQVEYEIVFVSFHSCSSDIISSSFAYQDAGLHVTSVSTLNANILRIRLDIEKWSTAFFPILSDLSPGELSFQNRKLKIWIWTQVQN